MTRRPFHVGDLGWEGGRPCTCIQRLVPPLGELYDTKKEEASQGCRAISPAAFCRNKGLLVWPPAVEYLALARYFSDNSPDRIKQKTMTRCDYEPSTGQVSMLRSTKGTTTTTTSPRPKSAKGGPATVSSPSPAAPSRRGVDTEEEDGEWDLKLMRPLLVLAVPPSPSRKKDQWSAIASLRLCGSPPFRPVCVCGPRPVSTLL
jgi:hypothetical protein